MKVYFCLALLICSVIGDDYGGGDGGGDKGECKTPGFSKPPDGGCPEGTNGPLPPPTDDQARQAAAGMTSAMKPKANERSQRFIKLTIPSDDKTCPKPIEPTKEEVDRAMALVQETSEVNIPEGMVVDQIMTFDQNGCFIKAVPSDPYVPDSPERPDSAVQN